MLRNRHLRWLAAGLAACALAGCGAQGSAQSKSDAKTLTHGRFVYLADRSCRRFLRGVVRRGRATTFAKARKNYEESLSAYQRLLFTLRFLAPPSSDAVAYRRMLATADDENLLLHDLFDAVNDAERRRVKTLARRLRRTEDRFDARAAKVGLRVCARE